MGQRYCLATIVSVALVGILSLSVWADSRGNSRGESEDDGGEGKMCRPLRSASGLMDRHRA